MKDLGADKEHVIKEMRILQVVEGFRDVLKALNSNVDMRLDAVALERRNRGAAGNDDRPVLNLPEKIHRCVKRRAVAYDNAGKVPEL